MIVRPITKSDFLAGLQCPLRLWNRHRAPIPYEDREETSAMRAGTNVGLLAHRLFPGGIVVEAEPWEREQAVARTQALLSDRNVGAIFEAGFVHNGLHVRVDVLKRTSAESFALYEVKSSGEVKAQHIPDLAFQVQVARLSGLKIENAGIIHINKNYERGTELDVYGLFSVSDETPRVDDYVAGIEQRIGQQQQILRGQSPSVEPGSHCHDPYDCEFWDRCTACKPEDWVFYLPRLGSERYEQLRSLGIELIWEIPDDFNLSELQNRIREVLRTGEPYLGPGLAAALSEVTPPVSYLDFETISPAVPIWPGTYPYQRIPFQWSVHKTSQSGQLIHAEFLADGSTDPRRSVAELLVAQLCPSDERIVVYNRAFESSVLGELVDLYSDLAPRLIAIRDRFWDLLPVVRNHVYLPGFGGSFSIKAVAPAMVPQLSYAALDGVNEGLAASDAFIRLVNGILADGETEEGVRDELLAYCRLDTLAMVQVHQKLQNIR